MCAIFFPRFFLFFFVEFPPLPPHTVLFFLYLRKISPRRALVSAAAASGGKRVRAAVPTVDNNARSNGKSPTRILVASAEKTSAFFPPSFPRVFSFGSTRGTASYARPSSRCSPVCPKRGENQPFDRKSILIPGPAGTSTENVRNTGELGERRTHWSTLLLPSKRPRGVVDFRRSAGNRITLRRFRLGADNGATRTLFRRGGGSCIIRQRFSPIY